jgi:hypothetical protein
MQTRSSFALARALILFCVWTLATWLLEGRSEALMRGDALERAIYALVANLLLGVGGTAMLLRISSARGLLEARERVSVGALSRRSRLWSPSSPGC